MIHGARQLDHALEAGDLVEVDEHEVVVHRLDYLVRRLSHREREKSNDETTEALVFLFTDGQVEVKYLQEIFLHPNQLLKGHTACFCERFVVEKEVVVVLLNNECGCDYQSIERSISIRSSNKAKCK